MMTDQLSQRDKSILFWASFLSLTAAGVGFVFRVMMPDIWGAEFNITAAEVGALTGAALWPIAITMVIFSLLVDKIGYKKSMFWAFALQLISVVLTFIAKDTKILWIACFCAGLGHGVVEAVINPLCASIYRKEKSKMLNILHASWPAGIVLGGVLYLSIGDISWRSVFLFMIIPVLAYGYMFLQCKKFPVDERVEANVSNKEMLKEFGGLGAFLAITFLFYELVGHISYLADGIGNDRLLVSFIIGALGGGIFGYIYQSKGKWLFFFLCLIMIPLATAELATDGWIQTLMQPVMTDQFQINSGWAIVTSAFIMMVLRFFAGVPLKYLSPPGLLLFSSCVSIVGLYLLSGANGAMIFIAFILYGVGQTFYWPTVLGFVSEQFPKGGAMTLNTVSAMGLLTVGIFGFPFLGAVKDSFDAKAVKEYNTVLYQKYVEEKEFFGVNYYSINKYDVLKDSQLSKQEVGVLDKEIDKSARKTIKVAAYLPFVMAIAFILILIYYRFKGGYKPVEIIKNTSS